MQSKSTILVGLAVVLGVSYSIASRQGTVNKPDDGDWLYVDHDLAGTRYSHLKQITTKSVSQLAKVCAYSFPDKEPSQTAPIVSAGIMYLTLPTTLSLSTAPIATLSGRANGRREITRR